MESDHACPGLRGRSFSTHELRIIHADGNGVAFARGLNGGGQTVLFRKLPPPPMFSAPEMIVFRLIISPGGSGFTRSRTLISHERAPGPVRWESPPPRKFVLVAALVLVLLYPLTLKLYFKNAIFYITILRYEIRTGDNR